MSTVLSPSDLLTREQAAQYLGLKPQTMSVWACTKRYGLPYLKVGSLVRYRRADLDGFLEARTIGADPADSQC